MRQVPRWQIWVPRLLLLGVALLAVQLGLGIAARSVVTRSTQAALGIPVEIEHSRVALGERRVLLGKLEFNASPQADGRFATADVCDLELEARPLLHKQFIARQGYLGGLRLDVASAVSAAAAGRDASSLKWFRDDADQVAAQWFTRVAERLHQDAAARLESVKHTEAFLVTWSRACAAIDARGQELDRQAAEIENAVESNRANPLRNVPFLAELPRKAAELQAKFTELCNQLEEQAELLEHDRRAIVAARRRDEEAIGKPPTLDPINADAITAYLLRSEATKPLSQIGDVLQWARTTWPKTQPKSTSGGRGEDVLFAGCGARPNFLVRALQLRGTARVANQPVELRGVLTDFSSSPAVHNEPMRLRLRAAGSLPVELQATVDRTRGAFRDALLIDADGILLPAVQLGRADQIALTVEPSAASLSISLSAENDQLTGELQIVQRNVRIVAAVGREFSDIPLAQALNESLGKVNSLATRISLAGTLKEPKCTLWSNLGAAVAEAMQRAAERSGGQRTRALLAEAARLEDEQLATAERQISEQQARWSTRVATVGKQLQTMVAAQRPNERLSPSRVGRRLPGSSLVR